MPKWLIVLAKVLLVASALPVAFWAISQPPIVHWGSSVLYGVLVGFLLVALDSVKS